ncbi:DDE-type integrase/transposase/recombinase [Rahnella sp. ChDrAdgB13]|uniref:DDE-type integrase/transposase/recombinase n=1 Tax=Rahnella sp. ChDrAdgB13 TaxID=1850581 RepID=UPI001AD88326|nr:DDE-type integrase/transposase/recombinase [Rahnella sp. ChDrAdgB13]
MGATTAVPVEAIAMLRRRLAALPARHPERLLLMDSTASLYAVSRATLYRLLRGDRRAKDAHRADRGKPRILTASEIERWCEIVAALKVRTTNKKGRCLSNARILELLVEYGVETPDGLEKLMPGRLTASTLNRHMRRLGYDQSRISREPPAVRFQAEHANALWHFDMSPSDLKELETPSWLDPDRQGSPTLMLFSVVDDRSGVSYQEYRCVYGEDVETALRFLFNAMSAKPEQSMPFQGIPETIQLDNGPVGKSAIFKRVMNSLGVEVIFHLPRGSDGRRTTARSKGKVERPFRTVKEAHETLYHFHKPETEAEANRWLTNYIAKYNAREHRHESHSRLKDWLSRLPGSGLRAMCSWERFCSFAREPERRTVGIDCRLTVAGVAYELDPELAGETVIVWWGIFDQELFAELDDRQFGPFLPVDGPIPIHRYRKHRKSRREYRAEQVCTLADKLSIPRAAVSGEKDIVLLDPASSASGLTRDPRPFTGPDPFCELAYPTKLAARQAIADELRLPLAKLKSEDQSFIGQLLDETLSRPAIIAAIRTRFPAGRKGGIS